jgi:hypothetical protein
MIRDSQQNINTENECEKNKVEKVKIENKKEKLSPKTIKKALSTENFMKFQLSWII